DADAPFGLPYRPNPFTAQIVLAHADGEEVIDVAPIEHRYGGNIFSGEKRMQLLVTPAVSVSTSPEIAILPSGSIATASNGAGRSEKSAKPRAAAARDVRVTIVNDSPSPAETSVKLELPPGWTASPPQQSVALGRPDESQTVRFEIRPSSNAGT